MGFVYEAMINLMDNCLVFLFLQGEVLEVQLSGVTIYSW